MVDYESETMKLREINSELEDKVTELKKQVQEPKRIDMDTCKQCGKDLNHLNRFLGISERRTGLFCSHICLDYFCDNIY